MEHYPYDKDEPEPVINIEIGDDVWEFKPHNTEVNKYLGKFAIYDHIIHTDEDREESMYLFHDCEVFDEIIGAMIELQFPFHLFLQVPDDDVIKYHTDMKIDEIEDGWNN
jgi:hypothetical protein